MNPTLTPTQLVQDVLLGSGVTVSNITYNGVAQPGTAQPGSASFTQVGDLGIDSGVLLSTGFPASAIGPSDNFSSDDIGNNGNDPDLEAIMGGNLTNYSILEFDFVPVGDSVKFNYVFGSEEYPTFVCSFNDAFGFFLSGPGISGPYTNGAINIAVLPDGVTPVTIANVNSGQGNDPNNPTCPAVNPEYYVNNSVGQTVAFGGMTVVLTARSAVQCGQTYHIKLAIADAGGAFGDTDTAYDSAVFLEGGSFTSAPFVPSLTPGPGIVGNTMFESCFPMELTFLRALKICLQIFLGCMKTIKILHA
ncbi:MAG TPA: choice-of-anchor L domain-containing protein, partial [Flavobacteriales bacterium]|nr:choice-of-anchor L domain-containing protein [Flavobacteriales bacterium]